MGRCNGGDFRKRKILHAKACRVVLHGLAESLCRRSPGTESDSRCRQPDVHRLPETARAAVAASASIRLRPITWVFVGLFANTSSKIPVPVLAAR